MVATLNVIQEIKQEMMWWQWHQLDYNANHLQLAADR